MTEQCATPTPPRALFVLRGGDSPGTADPVPGPEPATVPLVLGTETSGGTGASTEPGPVAVSVPLTVPERTRLAVAHWASTAANGAGQLWLHPGRLGHSIYYGKPGSLAEHRAYIKSREWRPEELKDHRSGTVIVALGAAYHLLIARPVKAACLIVSASADRPLRLTGLIAFLAVFAVFVLPRIPLI